MLAMIQESQPVKKQQLGGGGGDGDGELKEVTETEGGGGGGEVQPCPLDFDLREIEGFRYRVEDGKGFMYYTTCTQSRVN